MFCRYLSVLQWEISPLRLQVSVKNLKNQLSVLRVTGTPVMWPIIAALLFLITINFQSKFLQKNRKIGKMEGCTALFEVQLSNQRTNTPETLQNRISTTQICGVNYATNFDYCNPLDGPAQNSNWTPQIEITITIGKIMTAHHQLSILPQIFHPW